jgi:hypothetical protein
LPTETPLERVESNDVVVAELGATLITLPARPKLVTMAVPPGLLVAVAVVVALAPLLTVVVEPAKAGPAITPKVSIVNISRPMTNSNRSRMDRGRPRPAPEHRNLRE